LLFVAKVDGFVLVDAGVLETGLAAAATGATLFGAAVEGLGVLWRKC
jgi:hypothetical protein